MLGEILYLFHSVAFSVGSYLLCKSISYKQGSPVWKAIFICGLALGIINVWFFTRALREIQLSIAYPIFSGGCIFFMVLLAYLIFGERITVLNIIGAAAPLSLA